MEDFEAEIKTFPEPLGNSEPSRERNIKPPEPTPADVHKAAEDYARKEALHQGAGDYTTVYQAAKAKYLREHTTVKNATNQSNQNLGEFTLEELKAKEKTNQ